MTTVRRPGRVGTATELALRGQGVDINGDRLINIEQMLHRLLFQNPNAGVSFPDETGMGISTDEPENQVNYMEQVLATEMTYHPFIIEALKDFKRKHKIGNESIEARFAGMNTLLAEIASSHNMPIPLLEMRNITGEDSGDSYYDRSRHAIVMQGKLSIITFLHEIAHAVFRYDEHNARVWSIKLFKKVYPKAFARLKVKNGFVLVMQDGTIAAPTRASGVAEISCDNFNMVEVRPEPQEV